MILYIIAVHFVFKVLPSPHYIIQYNTEYKTSYEMVQFWRYLFTTYLFARFASHLVVVVGNFCNQSRNARRDLYILIYIRVNMYCSNSFWCMRAPCVSSV